jgi:hypothetical protein
MFVKQILGFQQSGKNRGNSAAILKNSVGILGRLLSCHREGELKRPSTIVTWTGVPVSAMILVKSLHCEVT